MRGLFACLDRTCRKGDLSEGPSLIVPYCCTEVAGARSSTELTGRLPG